MAENWVSVNREWSIHEYLYCEQRIRQSEVFTKQNTGSRPNKKQSAHLQFATSEFHI